MTSLPFGDAAPHFTTALWPRTFTVGRGRRPGAPAGVTLPDAAEAGESPTALVATTVNVYAVPLASPGTVQVSAPAVAQEAPPGDAVAV